MLHRARLQRGTGIGRRMLRVQSSEVFDSPGGNTELGESPGSGRRRATRLQSRQLFDSPGGSTEPRAKSAIDDCRVLSCVGWRTSGTNTVAWLWTTSSDTSSTPSTIS